MELDTRTYIENVFAKLRIRFPGLTDKDKIEYFKLFERFNCSDITEDEYRREAEILNEVWLKTKMN